MIKSLVHPGSGLGNQLFRIIAGKVLALDKGYESSVIGSTYFKGKSFMKFDLGKEYPDLYQVEEPAGKIIPNRNQIIWEEKTSYYTYRQRRKESCNPASVAKDTQEYVS